MEKNPEAKEPMMRVPNPFGYGQGLSLPEGTEIIRQPETVRIPDPARAIRKSLEEPIGSPSLEAVARARAQGKRNPRAVVVVSDTTRPVPYKGEEGILLPVVETLLRSGYKACDILILVATGTHRPLERDEIARMLDPRVLSLGCPVENHDCRDASRLRTIGTTGRGTRVDIDTRYMDADLKILTGLVESHFMAGVSGGRKSVCPGLIGEKTTYVFHGPDLMADPRSRDLNLADNPVHEESLAVAKMAGADFIVNVTLDSDFHVTGVFSGDLEKAHQAAFRKVRREAAVAAERGADIVVTHGGYVGVNHYQCGKCAVTSLGVLRKGGWLVILADLRDKGNKVGGINYRTALALLKLQGPEGFLRTIRSPDWTFLPEQWQVQQWGKVFERIPMDHLLLYAPGLTSEEWEGIPGRNAGALLPPGTEGKEEGWNKALEACFSLISRETGKKAEGMDVAYIADGPYVIPLPGEDFT